MFVFRRKKDKNNIPTNLKGLKKDAIEIHFVLKDKVNEYLLEDESVIIDGRLGLNSYFATEKRIIVIEAINKKLKGMQVSSYYYNNIESIKYSESTIKKLNYDILTINFKGSLKTLLIQLPKEVTKEIYNIINNYIASDTI